MTEIAQPSESVSVTVEETPDQFFARTSAERRKIETFSNVWSGEVAEYTPIDTPEVTIPCWLLRCTGVKMDAGHPDVPVCSLVYYEYGMRGLCFVDSSPMGAGPGTWRKKPNRLLDRIVALENLVSEFPSRSRGKT